MNGRRILDAVNPLGWLVVAVCVGIWQLLVGTGVLEFEYLPAPSGVVDGFSQIVDAGEVSAAVGHTLTTTLIATGIAMVVGVLVGALLGALRWFEYFTSASIDVARTLPVVALMPVVLLIWGPTRQSELIAASWAATWPVLVNTAAGVQGIHPRLREVATTMRLGPVDRFRKIIAPAIMPAILVGGRLAVINGLVVAVVAEMLINPAGLGWKVVESMQGLQPEQMWAWALLTGMIGYVLNVALIFLVRHGAPGGRIATAGAPA